MLLLNTNRKLILQRRMLFQTSMRFSQQKKNEYQILNVKQTASFQQIKKSFLALSKLYHPDYYKGKQTNKFHQIQDAFKKIYSPQSRKQVDLKLGIKSGLWQNQHLKADTEHFQNQFFQQMLKTQLGVKSFRSIQQRLQQKFKDQIDKQISKLQLIKSLWPPLLIFCSIWLCYNTLEQLLIRYQGKEQHIIEVQESKKKLSSIPINIR